MDEKLQKVEEKVQLMAQKHHLYKYLDWAYQRKYITSEEHLGIKKLLSSQAVEDVIVGRSVLEAKVNPPKL